MNLGTALVTGGASGMGLAIVERLARDGFSVVMADRNGALAEQESQALRARGLPVAHRVIDLTDEAATRAMVSSLPPLAALVNNAGLFDERKFFDVGTEDFRRAFDVNLLAVATLTQEAARTMAAGAQDRQHRVPRLSGREEPSALRGLESGVGGLYARRRHGAGIARNSGQRHRPRPDRHAALAQPDA